MKNILMQKFRIVYTLSMLLGAGSVAISQPNGDLEKGQVLEAMRKSSDYMVSTVSCNGGYLWYYAEDFSERQGEAPGRESQVMVQGGTPEMGHLFLDMFDAKSDL